MQAISKIYEIDAGTLELIIHYDETENTLNDLFDAISLGEHTLGYDDNGNDRGIAIYPSTIELIIDDFEGDNYSVLKALLKKYTGEFPLNFLSVLYLEAKLNGAIIFIGALDGEANDANILENSLTFVDGINKYKEIKINPALLQLFWQKNLIRASNSIGIGAGYHSRAYGFTNISEKSDHSGYYVYGIENSEHEVNTKLFIEELFKLFNPDISINFDNAFLFGDLDTEISNFVQIDQTNIERIHSYIFGRYVVLDKSLDIPPVIKDADHIIFLGYDYNHNKADKFKIIYDNEDYRIYFHDWQGNPDTFPSMLLYKGTQFENVGKLLEILAKNFFSYFGFENSSSIFWKHKRYIQAPELIPEENIISCDKVLTIEAVEGVKIKDWFTGNYGSDGLVTDINSQKLIQYDIPLNAFGTFAGTEYRMNFYIGATKKRVVHFLDTNNGFRDIPQEVISRAEWEMFRTFRDKYNIVLDYTYYLFNKIYRFSFQNYTGIVRPTEIAKDYNNDQSNMTAIEVHTVS